MYDGDDGDDGDDSDGQTDPTLKARPPRAPCGANNDDDFEFNQDFEIEEGTRSPGWIRYQKRIK